jgi:acyl-CoA dehydrogenase
MVLARIDGAPAGLAGVSLFLLPRTLDDGTANAYRIVRLKDKLGTRSMASGEIRFDGALAYLVGPGRPRLPADGRHGQQLAPVQRHARGRADAAGHQRGAVHRPHAAGLRPAAGRPAADAPPAAKLLLPTEQARTWCSRPPRPARAPTPATPTPRRWCASSRR